MQYRKFGNTDLAVSEVGFGAWAIGGDAKIGETAIGWGPADDAASRKAIFTALDCGINFFDTADIYGLGHSESLLGDALGSRSDVIIATKAGNVARNEKFTTDYSFDHIIKACDASLKRLKRDVIDYYQLHTARVHHLQTGECIAAMQQLQRKGKIRYWGLSLNTFNPVPEADILMNENLGNGFQLVFNIINQKAMPVLQQAEEKGYGIIARMPLQFGLLTGKFDNGFRFAETDHRKNRLTQDVVDASSASTVKIWELCEKYNCTKAQLALSFILSYDAVSTIIPGIRTEIQARENTGGLFKLDGDDKRLIEQTDMSGLLQLIEQKG